MTDPLRTALRLVLAAWIVLSSGYLASLVVGLSALFAAVGLFSGEAPPSLPLFVGMTGGIVAYLALALVLAGALAARPRWTAPAFAGWAGAGLVTALAVVAQDWLWGLDGPSVGPLALLASTALSGACLWLLTPRTSSAAAPVGP